MSHDNEWIIRLADLNDASSIASIYSEAILARNATMVLDPVSTYEMEEKLRSLDEREVILVATDSEGEIQGWGIVKFYSDRPGYSKTCETSLFVHSGAQNQGIGNALQAHLLKSAKTANFHHVIVRIWAQNKSSIALHEKHGFTLVGIQKEIGHVDQKWIDVAVMQCLL